MPFSLGQIASAIDARIEGDPDFIITGLASLEDAGEGALSFVTSPKLRKLADKSQASALIAYPDFKSSRSNILRMANPYLGFARAMRMFYRSLPSLAPGIEKSAVIAGDCSIPADGYIGHNVIVSRGVHLGKKTTILAGTFVGEGTSIGDECFVFPNVTIRENVKIGNNVVIYSNAVIGSDGFGYTWDGSRHLKIPQVGTVVIGDDTEIGAGTTIDRATLGETAIGKGVIIDNLVQIAHNCRIGDFSIICAQVGLAGSSIIGKHVTLAGQVGIAGHLEIGDGATVLAQSGVAADIPRSAKHFGYPSRDIKLAYRIEAILSHLPEYIDRLRKLESQVAQKE